MPVLRAYPLLPFVATRQSDVPPGITRYASVDGSVPGAEVTWDHHVTGELVNLDAMPDRYDPRELQAVGTTLADTDAVASAVAVILGGKAELEAGTLRVLHSASHWCDQLGPDATVTAEENAAGRGLHEWVTQWLRAHEHRSASFADVTRQLVEIVARGEPLPTAEPDPTHLARAHALVARGGLSIVGQIALVDLTGEPALDPLILYELHTAPIAVKFARDEHGTYRYSVGVNPLVEHPKDLRPALAHLAKLEHAHGPPALLARPGPGSENWGGRATVFGSPWNYGSRLKPEEVAEAVRVALGLVANPA